MSGVRFLVVSGYVRSRNDGDTHWVGAAQVARLHNLPPGSWRAWTEYAARGSALPVIGPRFDGKYPDLSAGVA